MPDPRINPRIERLLSQLRSGIRRYVLLEGTAMLLVVLGALFWLSFGLDYAYFKASNLELPTWFRATFDVLVICLFAGTFVMWIGLRLLRSFRLTALALVLEKRFPELKDRLITAVEMSESTTGRETPLTLSMYERTVDDVVRATDRLELGDVFEKRPLKRALVLAVVFVASIMGLGWTNQDALARWKAGYVDLQQEYWQREHGLVVKVLAQPGDQIKPFQGLLYKHPRGRDLTLLIDVAERKRVPDRVQLRYRYTDGRGGGRASCSRVGERQFRHSFGGLIYDLEFWVTGGDFTNPEPYRIRVVPPPRVDRMVLECRYPDYIGIENADSAAGRPARDSQTVNGSQISIPLETEFLLRAECNKPLVRAAIEYDRYRLAFTNTEAVLTIDSEEGERQQTVRLAPEATRRWLSDDGLSFSVPFVLSSGATERTRERNERIVTPLGKPFPMRPDSPVRIVLEDTDDVMGSDAARLTINAIPDNPPIVETSLDGIGLSITRKANIPIEGSITDDYGIVDARFEFQTDADPEWQRRPLEKPPQGAPTEFRMQRDSDRNHERFEVLLLDLAAGRTLTVTVAAQDNDDLNGPHTSRGERYSFKIVSDEELLSLLYQKELNLRQRFERMITELKQIQQDLILNRTRVEEHAGLLANQPGSGETPKSAGPREQIEKLESQVRNCADRALHEIHQNANESTAVEESFRDIRDEMVNNQVATRQMLERIDTGIVNPLKAINATEYAGVDELLGLFKSDLQDWDRPNRRIDETLEELDSLIDALERILLEMRKLETFQEALEILKAIISEEEQLRRRTDSLRKKQAIEKLKQFGLDQ